MEVELKTWTGKDEKGVYPGDYMIMPARGDYMADSLVKKSVHDVIDSVNKKTVEKYGEVDDVDEFFDVATQTEIRNEKRRAMISRLIKVGHYGPAEHPSFTFAVEGVSRVCATQLRTHRHASFDQQSMRYVNFEDVEVDEESFRFPETINSDGDEMSDEDNLLMRNAYKECYNKYIKLLDQGFDEEKARFVLPLGFKTNLSFSLNARSLMHIIDMRHAGDAQDEIRELMDHVLTEFEDAAPFMYEAYTKFGKGSSKKAP